MKNKTSHDQASEIRKDAQGQFAPKQAGGKNDGVADAKPRVLMDSEDATVHNRPPAAGKSDRRRD